MLNRDLWLNKTIGVKFRESVKDILKQSPEIQDSTGQKRHNRWWYKEKRVHDFEKIFDMDYEISYLSNCLFRFIIESKFTFDSKNQVLIDYNGGNGVLCLYLNKLGYNTYFYDLDPKEATHLLSNFSLEHKIIYNRDDIFDFKEAITVAMATDSSLNDGLGKSLCEIATLKYMFLDYLGRNGGGWTSPTNTDGFKLIEKTCSGIFSENPLLPISLHKKIDEASLG